MNAPETLALLQPQMLRASWNRPSSHDWARVLAAFPLFSGVSKRRLRKLVRKATFAEFAPGDTVNSGGGNGDSIYLILGGAATARDRESRALSVGDYFGEGALNGGASRSTRVVATRALHVMRLPRRSLPGRL